MSSATMVSVEFSWTLHMYGIALNSLRSQLTPLIPLFSLCKVFLLQLIVQQIHNSNLD